MTREDNIEIFNDTVQKIILNDDLLNVVNESTNKQQLYIGDYSLDVNKHIYKEPVIVSVTKDGTFDAALKYGNVCVLNFASSVSPGGGVTKGSFAQEETLCRTSTLYFNLNTKECWDKFYNPHKIAKNYLNFDDIIYTPNVQILKTNDYKDLPVAKSCAVITCAAPQIEVTYVTDEQMREIHLKRGRKILDVAIKNGHSTLILGAFGCGAFKNDPKIVAKVYKDLMDEYKYAFKKVEFAVYSPNGESENYKIFKEALK